MISMATLIPFTPGSLDLMAMYQLSNQLPNIEARGPQVVFPPVEPSGKKQSREEMGLSWPKICWILSWSPCFGAMALAQYGLNCW